MTVRIRLKKLRAAAALSQQQLADLAGVRRATIADLEAGKTTRIDFDVLDRISIALDCRPGDLFSRSDEPDEAKATKKRTR